MGMVRAASGSIPELGDQDWPRSSAERTGTHDPTASAAAPRRRWSRLRRGVVIVLVTIVFLTGLGLVYLAVLPGVGDAEARVRGLLDAHGASDPGSVPSDKLARAVIAVEDERFYAHHGIDLQGIARSLLGRITGDPGDQGGATITQQLARRLYLGGTLSDLGLALKFESRYSKTEILEMYLNVAYYGDNQYGARRAARTFFHKPAAELDWAEASLLAGLLQAPSTYDPTRHFERARDRQRHILDRLVATHVLSRGQANAAYRELMTLTA